MNKLIFFVAISGFWCLPVVTNAATAPRDGVQYDFNFRSTGKIYFQPQVPDKAREGEIWIDSNNGDRFFYYEGAWVSRDARLTVSNIQHD